MSQNEWESIALQTRHAVPSSDKVIAANRMNSLPTSRSTFSQKLLANSEPLHWAPRHSSTNAEARRHCPFTCVKHPRSHPYFVSYRRPQEAMRHKIWQLNTTKNCLWEKTNIGARCRRSVFQISLWTLFPGLISFLRCPDLAMALFRNASKGIKFSKKTRNSIHNTNLPKVKCFWKDSSWKDSLGF